MLTRPNDFSGFVVGGRKTSKHQLNLQHLHRTKGLKCAGFPSPGKAHWCQSTSNKLPSFLLVGDGSILHEAGRNEAGMQHWVLYQILRSVPWFAWPAPFWGHTSHWVAVPPLSPKALYLYESNVYCNMAFLGRTHEENIITISKKLLSGWLMPTQTDIHISRMT